LLYLFQGQSQERAKIFQMRGHLRPLKSQSL